MHLIGSTGALGITAVDLLRQIPVALSIYHEMPDNDGIFKIHWDFAWLLPDEP